MKIGIVTLLDNKNYGNRWQNYAMNELLKNRNIDTINFYFWNSGASNVGVKAKIKNILPIKLSYLIHIIRLYKIDNIVMLKRVVKFSKFSKKYMNNTLCLIKNYSELQNMPSLEECSYIVVGSDQVWNPHFAASDIFFLRFTEKRKRVAFAASFGCDEIPDDKKKLYKNYLNDMGYISVREPSGAEIVANLVDKHVDIFLDPTLLVEQELWLKICKKPNINLPSNYAISFMFDYNIDKIKNVCKGNNVDLLVLNDRKFRQLFSLDPAEMLYVILNAKMVFTDSFHIMALSIKLNKQFYVFNRPGFEYMFSRLLSTIERLELHQCIFNDFDSFVWEPISIYEYSRVNKYLKNERERFLDKVDEIII